MGKGGFKVFDSDMHIMEPPDLWQRYIAPEFRDQAPRGVTSQSVRDLRLEFPDRPVSVRSPHRGKNFTRNQATYAGHASRGWSPDVQLEAMDVEGIDVAALYPSRALLALTRPDLEPRFANAIARAYNDWLFEFCQADRARLLGVGMISVYGDVGYAVEEAHRAVEELGFRAVFVRANVVNGKQWHEPYYEPLWDALEHLGVPLGFHEAFASDARQTGDQFPPNIALQRIYGQPVEQMLALGSFIAGGVAARHPRLHAAFLEANCSWVPWLVWRMDEAYEMEGDLHMRDLDRMPSEYFKRQCIVSIEPDELPACKMIDEIGLDRIVFSTDYPHGDSRYPKSVESLLALPLSDEQKRKILWDNCARFYAVREGVPV